MALSMFSAQVSPIAIDFGCSSVKLLQIGMGEQPEIIAAVEVSVPDEIRQDTGRLHEFYAREIPTALRRGKFRGKRAVTAVPSGQTFIQHMQIAIAEGVDRQDLIRNELQLVAGIPAQNVVVRAVDVTSTNRGGQSRTEVICFAIARDTVMRHVDLLKRCKLDVVGVHTETLAMVGAFDHVNRRESDREITTLYVDVGWGGIRAAMTHGQNIVFARYVPVGGRHFDQHIARTLNCDVPSARGHRMGLLARRAGAAGAASGTAADGTGQSAAAEQSQETATATADDRRVGKGAPELQLEVAPGTEAAAPQVRTDLDLGEMLETVADELWMCVRYHRGLFRDRNLDRVVLLGGESRQPWLCKHLVNALGVRGFVGDPLARLRRHGLPETPGLDATRPQPGWAVPFGLCTAPTDL